MPVLDVSFLQRPDQTHSMLSVLLLLLLLQHESARFNWQVRFFKPRHFRLRLISWKTGSNAYIDLYLDRILNVLKPLRCHIFSFRPTCFFNIYFRTPAVLPKNPQKSDWSESELLFSITVKLRECLMVWWCFLW